MARAAQTLFEWGPGRVERRVLGKTHVTPSHPIQAFVSIIPMIRFTFTRSALPLRRTQWHNAVACFGNQLCDHPVDGELAISRHQPRSVGLMISKLNPPKTRHKVSPTSVFCLYGCHSVMPVSQIARTRNATTTDLNLPPGGRWIPGGGGGRPPAGADPAREQAGSVRAFGYEGGRC